MNLAFLPFFCITLQSESKKQKKMIESFAIYVISMIVVISLLTMLGSKLKIAYPVLLVLFGLVVGLIPGLPKITLDPELILIIFLPPLLYESAMSVSVKEMRNWWRIILSYAFLLVLLTALSVALLAVWLIPGISLSTGFLLGGIVASTDAVSANVIMKYVKVPSRVSTIIETESMLNDASSLIVFSFALVAVATGSFDAGQASLLFLWMVLGGVGVGLLVTMALVKLMRWLRTDTKVSIVLSLIAPYIMYLIGEAIGASGVLAVVSGGMMLGYSNVKILDSETRIQGLNVWRNFAFLLNGFAFLLLGLDLPEVVSGIEQEGLSLVTVTLWGVALTALIIVVRFGTSLAIMVFSWLCGKLNGDLNRKFLFDLPTCCIVGWSGMRGVLALAAALSIPLVVEATGEPFPHRHLVLYLTFIIILITLLLQGSTLSALLKLVKFPEYNDHIPEDTARRLIQMELSHWSLEYIQRHPATTTEEQTLVDYLTEYWEDELSQKKKIMPTKEEDKKYFYKLCQKQRMLLYHINREHPEISEEIIRQFVRNVDLEEERLKNG